MCQQSHWYFHIDLWGGSMDQGTKGRALVVCVVVSLILFQPGAELLIPPHFLPIQPSSWPIQLSPCPSSAPVPNIPALDGLCCSASTSKKGPGFPPVHLDLALPQSALQFFMHWQNAYIHIHIHYVLCLFNKQITKQNTICWKRFQKLSKKDNSYWRFISKCRKDTLANCLWKMHYPGVNRWASSANYKRTSTFLFAQLTEVGSWCAVWGL